MRLHTRLMNSIFGKAALAAAALGGFLFFTGAPAAQAGVYGYREPRPVIRYDNYRLHRAIVRDGFYSPQANYWRHERRIVYAHAWRDRFGVYHRY
jgi:hypothetical protein